MEVAAIINARPLVPVSNDPDSPSVLCPDMILTQKVGVPPPQGQFTNEDLYSKQWRQVQAFADEFWRRCRQECLHTLQTRRKCTETKRNVKGDIVLLRDCQNTRNKWPMAKITAVFPGMDGRVREVQLKTSEQGTLKTFQRPISEIVLLLPVD